MCMCTRGFLAELEQQSVFFLALVFLVFASGAFCCQLF